MRTIEVSTGVFAKIWAMRKAGEENENAILQRILGVRNSENDPIGSIGALSPAADFKDRVLWREDVKRALIELGGEAHLNQIYETVRNIRSAAGRSLPQGTEAIVRRELENNSSDASAFTGQRDWFRSVQGIGKGIWALRNSAA